MRTAFILVSGLLMFGGLFFYSRLFVQHFPSAVAIATYSFVVLWFAATVFNMWVGISHAGYSLREELPIMMLLFGLPAAVALLVHWKFA
jgi:hypothetical protein